MSIAESTIADQSSTQRKPHAAYYGSSLRRMFALAQWIPPLAVRLAYRLFYVPRKRSHPTTVPQGFEKRFVQAGGYRICTHSVGEGRSVLVIHGWELGVQRFEAIMRQIAASGFRAVAFDIPGHGQSSGKQSDIVEICKVAHDLENDFGPFTAVVGHSYGGLCATNLLRIGMKFEKALLLATPATYESIIVRFGEFLHLRPRVLTALTDAIHRRYAPHRLERDFSAIQNLRSTPIPVLLVHDRDDPFVPFADAQRLAQAHPAVQIFQTTELGHNRIVSDPAVLARCAEFLSAPEDISKDTDRESR